MSEIRVRRKPRLPKESGMDLAVIVAQLRMSLVRIAEGRDAQDWRYRRKRTEEAISLIEDAVKSIEEELKDEVRNV